MLGGKQHRPRKIELRVRRLAELHLDRFVGGLAHRAPHGDIAELVVQVLRRLEAELLAVALLPGRGSEIGQVGLALRVGHLRDHAHIERIAVAFRAGELEHHAPIDAGDAGRRAGIVEGHFIDGAMRHELVRLFRRQRLSLTGERPTEQRGREQHNRSNAGKDRTCPLASSWSVAANRRTVGVFRTNRHAGQEARKAPAACRAGRFA